MWTNVFNMLRFSTIILFLAIVLPSNNIVYSAEQKVWALTDTVTVKPNPKDTSVNVIKKGEGWTITSTTQGSSGAGPAKQDWKLTAIFDVKNLPLKLKPGETVTIAVSGTINTVNFPQTSPMSSTLIASAGFIKGDRLELLPGPGGQQSHTLEGNSPGPVTLSFTYIFTVPEVGDNDFGIEVRGGPWGDTGVRWVYQDEIFSAFDEDTTLFAIWDKEFEGNDCLPVAPGTRAEMPMVKAVSPGAFINSGKGWRAALKGERLTAGDKVRCDQSGMMMLEFTDPESAGGFFMVDVNPNTAFCISQIIDGKEQFRPKYTLPEYAIKLVTGALRAVSHGWKNGSIFSVEAGTSVCGMRGTDVMVEFYPEADRTVINLKEGKAVFQSGTQEITLEAGQRVEGIKGTLTPMGAIDSIAYGQFEARFANPSSWTKASGVPWYFVVGGGIVLIIIATAIMRRKRTKS